MSRLLILQVLVALGNRTDRFDRCSVAYTEAQVYPPSQNEAEAKIAKRNIDPTYSVLFLSSGVFEVTIVPELSSASIPLGYNKTDCFSVVGSIPAHGAACGASTIAFSRSFTAFHPARERVAP